MAHPSDFITRVQMQREKLTQGEEKLIAELMKAPREVALLSAAEFAQRAGLHEATCSRLAKKLGFQSYGAFRRAIQAEYLGSDAANRMATTLLDADGDPLAHLIDLEVASLSRLHDHIDGDSIAAAASHLQARRIFFFAHGNAVVLANQGMRRFRRMALDVHLLQGTARDIAEGTLSLNKDDTVILFGFRRQPPGYAALMRRAHAVGATTLVIADEIGPALRPAPDVLLAAPRTGVPNGFQTLTVPMLILNALTLALGQLRGDRTLSYLSLLSELINDFEQDGKATKS